MTGKPPPEEPVPAPSSAVGQSESDLVEIYKLAMEEGLRRINHQDAEVGVARARLMQVLTVVIAATAFLAGSVLRGNGHSGWFYAIASVATALLILLFIATYAAIQPIRGWLIETSPKVLIQDYAEADVPATLAETYRNMAVYYDRYASSNEVHLERLRRNFQRVLGLAGADIACWVILAWAVGR